MQGFQTDSDQLGILIPRKNRKGDLGKRVTSYIHHGKGTQGQGTMYALHQNQREKGGSWGLGGQGNGKKGLHSCTCL
eukprot:1140896-Pelagomonas_calceolata.AAC.1